MSRGIEPVTILDVKESDSPTTVRLADGREFSDVDMALTEDDVERIRQGRMCIRCLEPTGDAGAFPELCPSTLPDGVTRWCNFPMRDQQSAEFAVMFKGTVHIGSRVNMSDEMTRLEEIADYEHRTGIILPDHVKNRA